MHYLPELYYLQDQKDFPLQKAVQVTAAAVGLWCDFFYAKIIMPKSKLLPSVDKQGQLPKYAGDREIFIVDLVNWLFENSLATGLFTLFLDDEPTPKRDKVAKFDHHDDTCCWVLNLTETEFSQLQSVWRENDLPEDLFYPEQAGLCIPYPGSGFKAKLWRALGVLKTYTPKQYQEEEKKQGYEERRG